MFFRKGTLCVSGCVAVAVLVGSAFMGLATTANAQTGSTQITPSPSVAEPANCTKTEGVGKCGDDATMGPVSCDGATCYQMIIRYGKLFNCVASSGHGLDACALDQCTETTYTFACAAVEGQKVCMLQTQVSVNMMPMSYSSGQPCGQPSVVLPWPSPSHQ